MLQQRRTALDSSAHKTATPLRLNAMIEDSMVAIEPLVKEIAPPKS